MLARPLFLDMGRAVARMVKGTVLMLGNRDGIAVISLHGHPVLAVCLGIRDITDPPRLIILQAAGIDHIVRRQIPDTGSG